jgi:hypothetical protein
MARTNDPHSATAQFFINTVDNDFLDFKAPSGQGWGYCVFGQVVEGMDVVDKIRAVPTGSKGFHQDVPKEDVIIEKVSALPRQAREALAELSGIAGLAEDEIPRHAGESLKMHLDAPVEHHLNTKALYQAAADAGLKALIRIDNWVRVMEPEKVTPRPGANMVYADPPREEMTDPQKLFRIFARFLSIEERELHLEDELAEYGYRLDELHEALNKMESWLRFDPELPYFPNEHADLLCVVAADLLGKGFGEDIRVERFADSLGMDRDALHNALVAFSKPVGFDLVWLIGEEARIAEGSLEKDIEIAPSPG